MNPRSALVADRVAACSPAAVTPDSALDGAPTERVAPPPSPERLAARRIVDQAKLLLIERQHMSEPEAYRWIQKTAMNRRLTMAAVAATIISGLDPAEAPAVDGPAV